MKHLLAEYTWPELRDLLATDPLVVVPVGAFEQHGHHLPLMVDMHLAGTVATQAAGRAGATGTRVVVTPTIWTGYSPHHRDFPGTITLDDATFGALVVQVVQSLAGHGFRRIVLLNGHGGNANLLRNAVQHLYYEHAIKAVAASYWDFALREIATWRQSEPGGIMHACEMETALMLATRPDLVHMELAKDHFLDRSAYLAADLLSGGPASVAASFAELSPTGVIGAPSLATVERGAALLDAMVDAVARFLSDYATWPLESGESPS